MQGFVNFILYSRNAHVRDLWYADMMAVLQWVMSIFGMDTSRFENNRKVAVTRVVLASQHYNDTINDPYGTETLMISEIENAIRESSVGAAVGHELAMIEENAERESSFSYTRNTVVAAANNAGWEHQSGSTRKSEIEFSERKSGKI